MIESSVIYRLSHVQNSPPLLPQHTLSQGILQIKVRIGQVWLVLLFVCSIMCLIDWGLR